MPHTFPENQDKMIPTKRKCIRTPIRDHSTIHVDGILLTLRRASEKYLSNGLFVDIKKTPQHI